MSKRPPTTPCASCGLTCCLEGVCCYGEGCVAPPLARQLVALAVADPMVPKGYMEIRDSDGKLLRRQYVGGNCD